MDRKICKEIEGHFYEYAAERARVEERRREIAESAGGGLNVSGIKYTGVSDPTLDKAERIERELGKLKGWIRVVEKTVQHFYDKPQTEFMAMVYTERQSVGAVCDHLFIDRSTYFRWREKILGTAALHAAGTGLIGKEG